SSGSCPSTTGLRAWISDAASRWAPRIAEPRNAWPSTAASVFTVSNPSWLSPPKRPVCRPYCVGGMPRQAKSVSVTSVIFRAFRLRGSPGRARRAAERAAGAPVVRRRDDHRPVLRLEALEDDEPRASGAMPDGRGARDPVAREVVREPGEPGLEE